MNGFAPFGKTLILFGIILIAAGLILTFGGRLIPLGRLPGDIAFRRGNFSFFFPVVSCIVISLLLTLLLNLFFRR